MFSFLLSCVLSVFVVLVSVVAIIIIIIVLRLWHKFLKSSTFLAKFELFINCGIYFIALRIAERVMEVMRRICRTLVMLLVVLKWMLLLLFLLLVMLLLLLLMLPVPRQSGGTCRGCWRCCRCGCRHCGGNAITAMAVTVPIVVVAIAAAAHPMLVAILRRDGRCDSG